MIASSLRRDTAYAGHGARNGKEGANETRVMRTDTATTSVKDVIAGPHGLSWRLAVCVHESSPPSVPISPRPRATRRRGPTGGS